MIITIIGELCHDIFVYGEVKRMCPEAPVPLITPVTTKSNLGMSGNVRQNLWSINPKLQIGLIHQQKEIKKTRYVDYKSNHLFLRIDEGEDYLDKLTLTEDILKQILESDIVIVSDYNKGFIDDETLISIGNRSKLSILDTKRIINQSIVDSYDFIKVNEMEYQKNKKVLMNNLNKTILTMGMKGAIHNGKEYPSPEQKYTVDVSGAGDTFTASFILKYRETNNIDESIIYANLMSSIVVSKRGVSTPY